MQFDLDLQGRRVLVVGSARASRLALARLHHGAATVVLISPADAPRHRAGWRRLISGVDVVLLVDVSTATESTVRTAARDLRVWISRETPAATEPIGRVTLVGGGPGADGLMTIAGRDALRAADVVFYDRLAPVGARGDEGSGAEWIDVGKTPGHHAVPQVEIERRMIAAALEGRTVVRLKGGDPFVFGRGGEEVAACRAAGVPVTVISGVTSAIAVPAAAGVPVTYREVSRMFTVVSGHAPLDDDTVAHLVGLGGTIVVLMGVNTLPHLSAALRRHGMAGDMPLAVIERGLTPGQRTTVTTVSDVAEVSSRLGVRSPAVVVIGEVVRLTHDDDAAADEALHDIVTMAAGR
jgi:uroporphyrin-III C-methyltransferase